MPVAILDRTILRLSGDNVEAWLSGLITNNLANDITFSALLTPQGKIIADFFVTRDNNDFILDTPSKFGEVLIKRLKMYKLREAIEIEDLSSSHAVHVMWNGEGEAGSADPRLPALGRRIILDQSLAAESGVDDYDAHRLSLGIPDSEWDFETGTTFPADANMDMLSGVDFKKGCFIGQEVVSRMKRMTTVKKRMRGLVLEGDAQRGDKIMSGERVIGEVLHVNGKASIGLIRLNRLSEAVVSLTVNGAPVAVMAAPDGSNN